jgi:hypothetical protein
MAEGAAALMATRPTAGFSNSAKYFEQRALRARDENERQRLLEVAEFYRSLARVVPALPRGFELNGAGPPNSRIQRWEARAEECRVLAEHFKDPQCRQQLVRLAETYDELALRSRDN